MFVVLLALAAIGAIGAGTYSEAKKPAAVQGSYKTVMAGAPAPGSVKIVSAHPVLPVATPTLNLNSSPAATEPQEMEGSDDLATSSVDDPNISLAEHEDEAVPAEVFTDGDNFRPVTEVVVEETTTKKTTKTRQFSQAANQMNDRDRGIYEDNANE